VVDHYRRRGAEARSLELPGRDGDPDVPLGPDLEHAVCACVRDVVGALKPEYGDILRRVDLEESLLGEVCGACTKHGCLSCACRRKAGKGA